MPRGIPNKPKNPKQEAHPFENTSLSPDSWNERSSFIDSFNEKESVRAPVESSIPIGEFASKTEGFAPRSRAAFTRAADDRVNHFIDIFAKTTAESFKGKTHMPKECIPEGRKFLWARKTVQGRPDDNNMGNLMSKKGWEIAQPDMYPGYAFYDDSGTINDSSGTLYMGGLVGMDRDERIHQAELNYFARQRGATDRQYSALKSSNPNVAPRSLSNMEKYNDQFFPSTESSRSHTSAF